MTINEIPSEVVSLLAALATSLTNGEYLTRPDRPLPRQLTVADICEELKVAQRTFYEWRAKGRAPRCVKLPNGELRIRRTDFDNWLTDRVEVA